ncbi:MAG: LptE family protein [Candidatus Omnitrophica bacterium]|nr:LptE family protein [Candidatus Omnitrophota bacterium]
MFKNKKNILSFSAFLLLFSVLSGCGYTTKSLLPSYVKTVYVESFKNSIDLTAEVSNKKPYKLYEPGLENKVTRAIVDQFIFDGTLKVVKDLDEADSVLSGELREYIKAPIRYDDNNDVIEFRVNVGVSARFVDKRKNKTIWEANSFSGDSDQRTQGTLKKSEDTARGEAVRDLARRIVEKTIEVW